MTMPSSPKVRVTGLDGVVRLLVRHDIAPAPLLARVGLPPVVDDPDGMIDLNAYANLLTLASEAIGDPCLGITLAREFPAGGTGILHYLLSKAPTLMDSVDCLMRYLNLQVDGVEATYEEVSGVGWIGWRYGPALEAPRAIFTEFALALIVLRLRAFTDRDWMPLAVEFEYRQPPCIDEYARVFGSRLSFNQPLSRIALAASFMRTRLPEGDARLYKVLREAADRELAAARQQHDFLARVRAAIGERLARREIDLEAIAGRLKLQPRQLQWRLNQLNTTFEAELRHVRQRLAEHLLADTDEKMTEIAFLLGFSEVSAFSRAAHRWFGMSPRQYRQQRRQA